MHTYAYEDMYIYTYECKYIHKYTKFILIVYTVIRLYRVRSAGGRGGAYVVYISIYTYAYICVYISIYVYKSNFTHV